LSQGDWLQYLDADDYCFQIKWQPDEVFQQNPSVDLVYGSHHNGVIVLAPTQNGIVAYTGASRPWVLLARWSLPQTGALFGRRKALRKLAAGRLPALLSRNDCIFAYDGW